MIISSFVNNIVKSLNLSSTLANRIGVEGAIAHMSNPLSSFVDFSKNFTSSSTPSVNEKVIPRFRLAREEERTVKLAISDMDECSLFARIFRLDKADLNKKGAIRESLNSAYNSASSNSKEENKGGLVEERVEGDYDYQSSPFFYYFEGIKHTISEHFFLIENLPIKLNILIEGDWTSTKIRTITFLACRLSPYTLSAFKKLNLTLNKNESLALIKERFGELADLSKVNVDYNDSAIPSHYRTVSKERVLVALKNTFIEEGEENRKQHLGPTYFVQEKDLSFKSDRNPDGFLKLINDSLEISGEDLSSKFKKEIEGSERDSAIFAYLDKDNKPQAEFFAIKKKSEKEYDAVHIPTDGLSSEEFFESLSSSLEIVLSS